ncbi:MAG TPA: hypothetical protein VFI02_07175 [Armatimonadota bacterium]|nr:hypothetical protein [Armatimonadota bacterium]
MDISEVRRLTSEIREAGSSDDPLARQRILKQFVIQLQVDQKEKRIEGRILARFSFVAIKW